ncbi:hypothetical protein D0S45_17925 [Marinifilum sp. JC120]|nr:hypothetical protein D0S45_17925 [Marinifilum sp. JC120]
MQEYQRHSAELQLKYSTKKWTIQDKESAFIAFAILLHHDTSNKELSYTPLRNSWGTIALKRFNATPILPRMDLGRLLKFLKIN